MAFTSAYTGAQIDNAVGAGTNASVTTSDTMFHSNNTGTLEFSNTVPTTGAAITRLFETRGGGYISNAGTGLTTALEIMNGNGLVGTISTTGTSTQYNVSSDPRLKSAFSRFDSTEAWKKFDAILLNAGVFHFLTDPSTPVWGFNAHGVIDAGLDFGSEGRGPRDFEIGEEFAPGELVTPAGVDQSKVVPYLVAVIADLRERLEAAGL